MTNATLQPLPAIESQESPECVHYWIIDTPAGPASTGRCRLCGESKEFMNYLESFSGWDEDRNLLQTAGTVRSSLNQIERPKEKFEEEE